MQEDYKNVDRDVCLYHHSVPVVMVVCCNQQIFYMSPLLQFSYFMAFPPFHGFQGKHPPNELYIQYVCGRENDTLHFLKWKEVWKFRGSNSLQHPYVKRGNGRTDIIACVC